MKELIIENATIILAGVLAIAGVFASKLKLTTKNNKMLKILDTLMMLVEGTELSGKDKKKLVMDMFEELRVGKIDNVEEYINDKIDLSNTINIKESDIKSVLQGNNGPQHKDPVGPSVEEIKMIELERENDKLIIENYELREEVKRLNEIVDGFEEINPELNVENEQLRKDNDALKRMLALREKQLHDIKDRNGEVNEN